MPALSSTQVLFAVSAMALGLYTVLKEGRSQLIDTSKSIGHFMEPNEKDRQDLAQDDPKYNIDIIGGGTVGYAIVSCLSEPRCAGLAA
jgi:hypothetical protein